MKDVVYHNGKSNKYLETARTFIGQFHYVNKTKTAKFNKEIYRFENNLKTLSRNHHIFLADIGSELEKYDIISLEEFDKVYSFNLDKLDKDLEVLKNLIDQLPIANIGKTRFKTIKEDMVRYTKDIEKFSNSYSLFYNNIQNQLKGPLC